MGISDKGCRGFINWLDAAGVWDSIFRPNWVCGTLKIAGVLCAHSADCVVCERLVHLRVLARCVMI